ncbi:hypothetical protein [Alienimonas californiensis]|uniref:Uncharacterized protein n=1 Tax=Alienimonas californiensis TaxID=2527989 RepID=A0A517P5A1_9PLAN|nr:hypothetical protein [Alienimonas californiensis]QDT14525.1 hypothetical protein CA12_06000 [Alienimonas californiensis]
MLQPVHALKLFAPESVPADRVVRAVLAATRLTPGDRALLHGPYAGTWEAVLEYLGVCVERAGAPAEARKKLLRPGGAAYEAAIYVGPAEGADRAKAVEAADLVRPGRNSLAVVHGDDLAAVPPADALRLPDRRGFAQPAGPGGWVLHTVPGSACWRGVQGAVAPAAMKKAA